MKQPNMKQPHIIICEAAKSVDVFTEAERD